MVKKTETAETDFSSLRTVFSGVNCFLTLLGIALFGIGIWIRVDTNFGYYVKHVSVAQYYQSTYFIMVIGFILFILCLSVVARTISRNMLLFYIFAQTIITILECAALGLVWGGTSSSKFDSHITKKVLELINKSLLYVNEEYRVSLDLIQSALKCCGANNYLDYSNSSELVPRSCFDVAIGDDYSLFGCGEALAHYLRQMSALIGGFIAGVMLFQLLSMFAAGCLHFKSSGDDADDCKVTCRCWCCDESDDYTGVSQQPDSENGKLSKKDKETPPEKKPLNKPEEEIEETEVFTRESHQMSELSTVTKRSGSDPDKAEQDSLKQSSVPDITQNDISNDVRISVDVPKSGEKSVEVTQASSEQPVQGSKPPSVERKPDSSRPHGIYLPETKYRLIHPSDLPKKPAPPQSVSSDV